ncbi:MAG: sugar transferase [Planctomycetes bacterium]|nr:sugar transferase [Planctomycetota bacterium]MBL7008434.1 sugar transferase [Planctomycetota bacterium]
MGWLRRNFDTCFIVIQVWLDGFTILLACVWGLGVFRQLNQFSLYRQLVVVIIGVTLVSFWNCGLYRWRKSILNVEEYRSTFQATMLSFLGTATTIYLLRAVEEGDKKWDFPGFDLLRAVHDVVGLADIDQWSRFIYLLIFAMIFGLMVVQRGIMFKISSMLHAAGFGNTNVAVFGTGDMAQRVEQKMRIFPTLGFHFVGYFDEGEEPPEGRGGARPYLGGRRQLEEMRVMHGISRVIISKPEMEEDELIELCGHLENLGIEYQVVPRLYHFFSQRFAIDSLDSIPLITLNRNPGRPIYRLTKSLVDRLLALVLLALLSPFLLLIGLLIRRESSGPVLFSQVRVGFKQRTFRMIKFRTMYHDMCVDAATPNSRSDPRVTRIGRFLRRTSLDELPQLVNVLRGEMSLVGPRPEMPFIVGHIQNDMEDPVYHLRFDTKPGITGLWQVSSARKAPIQENIDYDLYYLENQSVFLDIVILFLTALAVLRIRETY